MHICRNIHTLIRNYEQNCTLVVLDKVKHNQGRHDSIVKSIHENLLPFSSTLTHSYKIYLTVITLSLQRKSTVINFPDTKLQITVFRMLVKNIPIRTLIVESNKNVGYALTPNILYDSRFICFTFLTKINYISHLVCPLVSTFVYRDRKFSTYQSVRSRCSLSHQPVICNWKNLSDNIN